MVVAAGGNVSRMSLSAIVFSAAGVSRLKRFLDFLEGLLGPD